MLVPRTPDERLAHLEGYPFSPHCLEADGGRLRYVDEGTAQAPVVWLQHGEPSWSYDFRRVVRVLVGAGYRVIAPDLVGFGRSDKPVLEDAHICGYRVRTLETMIAPTALVGAVRIESRPRSLPLDADLTIRPSWPVWATVHLLTGRRVSLASEQLSGRPERLSGRMAP